MARIITILFCGLLCGFGAASAQAQRSGDPSKDARMADEVVKRGGTALKIADGAPDRYTVRKGDTLWDISKRYLSDPWRWPELWRGNKDQVSDPHWIYPGEVLVLDRTSGTLSVERGSTQSGAQLAPVAGADGSAGGASEKVVRLQPAERSQSLEKPIPVIPAHAIEPYLSRPLVVEGAGEDSNALRDAPILVASLDGRVILGVGDRAFVTGMKDDALLWQVFRPGKQLIDPDTKEVLGREATHLGNVKVLRRGDPSEVLVVSSKQEMLLGDRLIVADRQPVINFALKRPDREINARVMSIYGGVDTGGQYSVVSINKGKRDGIEVGNVLALFRKLKAITLRDAEGKPKEVPVPDDRFGLVTVFRVSERVSYALVMEAAGPTTVGDSLRNP